MDKGCSEQEHIDRLTGQAIEWREDAPPRLPREILREIDRDEEVVRLRCVKDEAIRLARNAAPEILLSIHLKYKTKRLGFLDAVRTRIEDVDKQKKAIELFYDALEANRTWDRHRRRLTDKRFVAYRDDWFRQANASDALYRPTTAALCRPTIDTTGARRAFAWTPTSLDLYRLFHPEDELKSLSLELIETLAVVDLVDTARTGAVVKVFPNLKKLQDYTIKNEKYFPKEDAYAGGLLRFLLREILHSYAG